MEFSALNDDCVLHLFHFLDPEDLLTVEEVSLGLRHLAYQFYRLCRAYEWSKRRQRVNKKIIERIGASLRTLVYRGIGSTDIECFSAVNRWCAQIASLTLYDVTIDSNLIRLLMPVLDHLKHLHIDRYLMAKQVRVEGPLNEGEEPPEEEAADVLSDIQCLMLCVPNLTHLLIGEPFDKDSFMSHDCLSTLWNLQTLNLNLTRNVSFAEFGDYFSHTFLPLHSLELILPNEGVTDYDKFCAGVGQLQKLTVLKLHNLQNKHFSLLIPGLRGVKGLRVLHLNCAQGVILSKSVQHQMARIDNKMLQEVAISALKNSSFHFLASLKWWPLLRSFELVNCEKLKNEDLLEICSKMTNKCTTVTVRDNFAVTQDIVHLLVRISKLRIYTLTFNFYHNTQEMFNRFQRETEKTIIQNINVNNYRIVQEE